MGSRNNPDTSKSAYAIAKQGLIENHKTKIRDAMQNLPPSNYEAIAVKCGLDRIACMRRLNELEKDQIIFKPGSKSLTKSGRMAYNYSLVDNFGKAKQDLQTVERNLVTVFSLPDDPPEPKQIIQSTLF